ncbi:MAG: ABC transporter substrate-binding protein [Sphingomonadaceae bacterium]
MKDVPKIARDGDDSPGGSSTPRGGIPSLSRRQFLGLVGAAAGSLALSGCGSSLPAPAPSRAGEKVQLVYQDARAEWFLPTVQQMLEQFHETHPNIRVFYTPEPDSPKDKEEKMLAAMQAGTAPDVFQGCCSWFPIWAQKGYLLDLRSYIQADLDRATLDDWDPAQYRYFFTRDGRQYGLPKYHGALALYYNKDLFDRYHVDYPDDGWDHDDYLMAMRQLTHDTDRSGQPDLWGSMTYVSWDRIQMHVNGWGGHLIDPADPTRCMLDKKPAMEALEWLRARMWDERVMATTLDVEKAWPNDAFAAGRIAMVEDGSWNLKPILTKAAFHVGVAPFPAGPTRKVTLATTDGFAIYAGTKHPEAAWELVKFLISKEYGRALAKNGFLQPARASLLDEWTGFVEREYPNKISHRDLEAFADGHLKGYSVTSEVAANMAEATRIATAAWDQILSLGLAPVTIMKDACAQIQEAQKGAGGGGSCCG